MIMITLTQMSLKIYIIYLYLFTAKNGAQDRDNPGTHILREPIQSKCTWTSYRANQMIQMREIIYSKKNGAQERDNLGTQILRQPAQLKCTWTFHKSNFMREFTAKMPAARWSNLI
jgi:hypothetical protein